MHRLVLAAPYGRRCGQHAAMTTERVDAIRLRDAPARGLTRASLRTGAWTGVSHGLYQRSELAAGETARLRALSELLPPPGAWSHYTGARLLRLWLPTLPGGLPTFATVPPGLTRPERNGLYVARSRARWFEPLRVDGLNVMPAPLLLGQLAEDLALLDLVVAIDSALYQRLCTVDTIRQLVLPHQRGGGRLLAAVGLADGRSESAYETVLRVFHVVCGFSVTPQYEVRDASGRVVARADLRIDETNRLAEYDGADHRSAHRHRDDLRREKVLARLGKERYGYTNTEILHQPGRVLRDAEEACGLPHDPRRMRRWLAEVRRSTLMPQGRSRLGRRLRRYDNCRTRAQ